jgi:hypothetical protein
LGRAAHPCGKKTIIVDANPFSHKDPSVCAQGDGDGSEEEEDAIDDVEDGPSRDGVDIVGFGPIIEGCHADSPHAGEGDEALLLEPDGRLSEELEMGSI